MTNFVTGINGSQLWMRIWVETCMEHWRIQGTLGTQAPLPPIFFFKIMQFLGNFKGNPPILSKVWAQGTIPLGSKLRWGPLTKILDPLCRESPWVPTQEMLSSKTCQTQRE